MKIDLDIIYRLADRFGAPVVLLGALMWLAYLFVRGPAMKLAEMLGSGFGDLCRAGVDYLSKLSSQITALPGHVSLEGAAVRETVRSESEATRTHVTTALERLHDRVSATENELQRSITGQHQVVSVATATEIVSRK